MTHVVKPRPEQTIEQAICHDVDDQIIATGRLPRLAYMVHMSDAAAIVLRCGVPFSPKALARFGITTAAGPVAIVPDRDHPRGMAHRCYLCSYGHLHLHDDQCIACQMLGIATKVSEVGTRWIPGPGPHPFAGIDRSVHPEKLSGAKLGNPSGGSFDIGKALRGLSERPLPESAAAPVRAMADACREDKAIHDRQIPNCCGVPMPWASLTDDRECQTCKRKVSGQELYAERCDPLDVKVGGVTLRHLLKVDEERRREGHPNYRTAWSRLTDAQRDAVSAHWSAQLRAKVAASAAADKARNPSVMMPLDAENIPW